MALLYQHYPFFSWEQQWSQDTPDQVSEGDHDLGFKEMFLQSRALENSLEVPGPPALINVLMSASDFFDTQYHSIFVLTLTLLTFWIHHHSVVVMSEENGCGSVGYVMWRMMGYILMIS